MRSRGPGRASGSVSCRLLAGRAQDRTAGGPPGAMGTRPPRRGRVPAAAGPSGLPAAPRAGPAATRRLPRGSGPRPLVRRARTPRRRRARVGMPLARRESRPGAWEPGIQPPPRSRQRPRGLRDSLSRALRAGGLGLLPVLPPSHTPELIHLVSRVRLHAPGFAHGPLSSAGAPGAPASPSGPARLRKARSTRSQTRPPKASPRPRRTESQPR